MCLVPDKYINKVELRSVSVQTLEHLADQKIVMSHLLVFKGQGVIGK